MNTQVERRPRARKRRSDDGFGKTVKGILARNVRVIVLFAVGGFCVGISIAGWGCDWLGACVAAYGGALVMLGAMGGSR